MSWIHVARIQGRAYEELYSPDALAQPDQVRRSRIKTMADEVLAIMERSENMNVRALRPDAHAGTVTTSWHHESSEFLSLHIVLSSSFSFLKAKNPGLGLTNVENRLAATQNGPLLSTSTHTNSCKQPSSLFTVPCL